MMRYPLVLVLFLVGIVVVTADRLPGRKVPPGQARKEQVKSSRWGKVLNVNKGPVKESKILKEAQQVCGTPAIPPKTSRIVGGVEATPNSWPWQVRLYSKGYYICGASLVTARHVVTAAHCTINARPRNLQVVLGDHDQTENEPSQRTIGIRTVTNHPDYQSNTVDNDIAVLELLEDVSFTREISPVCLPEGRTFPTNSTGYTTGWGATEEGGSDSDKLLQVSLPIISTEDCRKTVLGNEILDSMICAGLLEGGKDTCQGDSGGPLVSEVGGTWYLCGVVSWGYGCARPEYPGVYAKVSALEEWVTGQLN